MAQIIGSLLKVDPNKRPDIDDILKNPLVNKHIEINMGEINNIEETDELLKTIKYNPRDLKGLKNILPKSNYEEEPKKNDIQSCKITRKDSSENLKEKNELKMSR